MKKIFFASVLKPVTDPRMFEKLAKSAAGSGKVEIHIAGYASHIPDAKKVIFYPLFKFSRISLQRLLAPAKIFSLLCSVRPDLLVICTHELLWMAVLFKIVFRKKIVYDIQENYYRNILYMNTFPVFIRHLLALYVRAKENITASFIDGFILAEQCYENELAFIANKYVVLENKFVSSGHITSRATPVSFRSPALRFVYTGTIAKAYGIFEAIEFIKILAVNFPVQLTIAGFATDRKIAASVKAAVRDYPSFIKLIMEDKPVSYRKILQELNKADLLLVPYQPNKATASRIPTKVYEALSLHLPVIIQANPAWEKIIMLFGAGISINYHDFKAEEVMNRIMGETFYPYSPGEFPLWKSEEKKWLKFLKDLLKIP